MSADLFVAYLSIGASASDRAGASLEIQRAAIDRHVHRRGRVAAEIVDAERAQRCIPGPRLYEALTLCRDCGATLLMADFGARSDDPVFLRRLGAELRRRDLRFAAADSPEASELTLGLMAALAEAEDRWGVNNTPDALARRHEFYARFTAEGRARAADRRASTPGPGNGRTRPPAEGADGPVRVASAQRSRERAEEVAPILSEIRAAGALTLEQVANALNALGVPSARGNRWYPMQVTRVEMRLADGGSTVRLDSRSLEQPAHA